MIALLSVQSSLPTNALANRSNQAGQQLTNMVVNSPLSTTSTTPSLCNEIHVLIRTAGVYRQSSFVKRLTDSGYHPTIKADPVNSNDLARNDVVIFFLTSAVGVTSEEITLLQEWVNVGGSLLIFYYGGNYVYEGGDQSIANAFGVSFGETILDPTDYQLYTHIVKYQKDNFSDHSIMQKIHLLYSEAGSDVLGAGEPLITADADATPFGAVRAQRRDHGCGAERAKQPAYLCRSTANDRCGDRPGDQRPGRGVGQLATADLSVCQEYDSL
jgi:hypothetical protein